MRETGQTLGVVHRAGIHESVKGNHGRLMPLHYEEVEAIGKCEFSYFSLEFFEILGGYAERRCEERRSKC